MRILLVSSAAYEPPRGGSTRSNLLWLRAIAEAGHQVNVVCGAVGEEHTGAVKVDGIAMERHLHLSRDASPIARAVDKLHPDFVLVSSEDLSHTILREAYRAAPARLVYVAHTPQWFPFGPEAWHQDAEAAEMVRKALGVVAIGHHMAAYIQEHLGRDATVIHPNLYGEPPWPEYRNFAIGKVLLINPCQVKGLPIFLELAKRFPAVEFAALRGWGTTPEDSTAMQGLPNVEVWDPVAGIDEAFSRTRLLLAPSLWYEGFGLVATEAQLRGIPVLAADYGGLAESTAASDFRQPVEPIRHWSEQMDATGMPIGEVMPQPVEKWSNALEELLKNEHTYNRERSKGLEHARQFAAQWKASDLLNYLNTLRPKRRRILLVHNSTYFPALGGGDKSNRLLMEALHQEGHTVEVFTRLEKFGDEQHTSYQKLLEHNGIAPQEHEAGWRFSLGGVTIRAVTRETNLRAAFRKALETFQPEVILTSTDDPAHLFLDLALDHPAARVIYLVRATVALPFGPDASTKNTERTLRLSRADAVVGVSHYVAEYCHTYANLEAVHVPISLSDNPNPPEVGRFENPYITLVNPSGVKGLPVLLGLADAFPQLAFAAVPSWGTTAEDFEQMRERPNITLLERADDITEILRLTRITLVPSLWAEARSRVVLESISRGVPVLASDVGGLREAMCGVDYVLPVRQITEYKDKVSEQMAPEAVVPEQNLGPWIQALASLTANEEHWRELSEAGRKAALEYIRGMSARPLESIFERTLARPKRAFALEAVRNETLSAERRRLLHLRIRKQMVSQKDLYLPVRWGKEGGLPVVLLPWAGAGTLSWRFLEERLRGEFAIYPVRLPQRELRAAYSEGTSMESLAEDIAKELQKVQIPDETKVILAGHSMGGALAYEIAKRMGNRVGGLLISSCRAVHLRRDEEARSQPQGLANMDALAADIAIFDAYRPQQILQLECPIIAASGKDEAALAPEWVAAWRELTKGEFESDRHAGDHFWLKREPERWVENLRKLGRKRVA